MQNKSTIGFLNKQYKNVLIKCFMAGIMAMSFAGGANAVDVANYDELKSNAEDNSIANQTINITNNINGLAGDAIGIMANKVINGNGFSFDGGKNSRGFGVELGIAVEFNNINFTNFTITGNAIFGPGGAAILNKSIITSITNSSFIGNYSMSYDTASASGGAIENADASSDDEKIKNIINSTFTGNYAQANSAEVYGGAISNGATIENIINSTFANNYVKSIDYTPFGGAIYNSLNSKIENIANITFLGNYAESTGGNAYGGAIHNYGTISNITNSTFTGNYAKSTSNYAQAGAINNYEIITDLTNSTFANNYAKSDSHDVYGGAIYIHGGAIIENITNNTFTNNFAQSTSKLAQGGAIYNWGTMTIKNSIFKDNYASGGSTAQGGAIYNESTINIIADNGISLFEGNYTTTDGGATKTSNAIHNGHDSNLGLNTVNLNAGTLDATKGAGLIHIKDGITGDLGIINVNATDYDHDLDDLDDNGMIDTDNDLLTGTSATPRVALNAPANGWVMIDGNVSGNNLTLHDGTLSFASGEVKTDQFSNGELNIEGDKTLYLDTNITSVDTINNKNDGTAGDIDDAMIAFRVVDDNAPTASLSIFTGDTLTGTATYATAYTNNHSYTYDGTAFTQGASGTGGLANAILATGTRTFSLTENVTLGAFGGTMSDDGTLTIFGNIIDKDVMIFNTTTNKWELNKDFDASNYYAIDGGTTYNQDGTVATKGNQVVNVNNANATLNVIDAVIKNAHSSDTGGAISNRYGTVNVYSSSFNNSTILSNLGTPRGGAISNIDGTANIYNSAFTNNSTQGNYAVGGAIYNYDGTANIYNSYFANNSAQGQYAIGGAIFNTSGTANIYNSTFINNSAQTTVAGEGIGGAIYNNSTANIYNSTFKNNTAANNGGAIYNNTSSTLNIYALNGNTEFTGNTAKGISNAIHNKEATINLMANNGSIIFDDGITSDSNNAGTINIGDANHNGTVVLNADMSGFTGDVNFTNGTIEIGKDMSKTNERASFFGGDFIVNAAAGATTTLNAANGVYEAFSMKKWNTQASKLNVIIDVDLTSGEGDSFSRPQVDDSGIKLVADNSIVITGININNPSNISGGQIQVAEAHNNNSYMVLDSSLKTISTNIYRYTVDDASLQTDGTLSFSGGDGASGFSGAALASSGARSGQVNNAVDISGKVLDPTRIIVADNMPSGDIANPFVSAWVDFSGSKEDVKLDNITVDNESYVGLVGADIKGNNYNGFNVLYSMFTGYTTSEQKYDGVTTDQNGFVLGGAITMQKGAITTATMANIGISFVDEKMAAGSSDYDMYTFSLANKTSYEHNIGCSIFSLIPSISAGYHYVWTEDYTNANGTNINLDGLHIFNINPELKLKADYGKYQPYASVGFNFNIDAGGDATADNAALPTLSVDNYAEFAVGVDAQIKDNISGYAEINATTSDRQGYGVQAGLKWEF